MLCSKCNKNKAVIFVNSTDPDGNKKEIGYCYNCAKELGINPMQSINNIKLSDEEMNNLTNKLNSTFKDIIEKMSNQEINTEILEEMQEKYNSLNDNNDSNENKNFGMGFAFPIGSIFQNKDENNEDNENIENETSELND